MNQGYVVLDKICFSLTSNFTFFTHIYTRLSYMTIKGSNIFAWIKPDIHTTPESDIIHDITETVVKNSTRGFIGLNRTDLKFVENKMVLNLFFQSG